VDEVAEERVSLAVELSAYAEARIEPRGIGQKGRVVLCVEVVGEVEVASPRLGRGIGLEEAPVTWVVLSGSQVVEAGVQVEVLTCEADRVGGGLVCGGGARVELVSVGVVAIRACACAVLAREFDYGAERVCVVGEGRVLGRVADRALAV